MKSKIKSNIDYHEIRDDGLIQYINCCKYDSDGNWKTLEELFRMDLDFIDLLFLKLTGRRPVESERRLFLKTLMILSLGTGCHPPSVMVPKLVACTTKNKEFAIINGLIGGLAAVGTDHLGAVVGMMNTLMVLKDESRNFSVKRTVEEYINAELSKGNKIRGFGHPVYKKDPRPDMLFKEIRSTCRSNDYVKIYDQLKKTLHEKKKINPNIDAIVALSYLVLGFEPEHGIYLSFLSRSLSMVCHILEEVPKKPFSFLNEMVSIDDFYCKMTEAERLSMEINEKIKKEKEKVENLLIEV
jgi:citrate synthase